MSLQGSFARRARRRIQRDLRQAVAGELLNTATVRFHYEVLASGEVNAYDERAHTAAYTARWMEFTAFVHYVQPAETGMRRFSEVKTGDVIVDVVEGTKGTNDQGESDLLFVFEGDGIVRPRFEIDGQYYTQRDLSADLARAWDVKMGGERILRTFLLRLMPGGAEGLEKEPLVAIGTNEVLTDIEDGQPLYPIL